MKTTEELIGVRSTTPTPLSEMLDDAELLEDYRQQKNNSIRRGIEFKLSYEEWLVIWLYSGKLHLRGKKAGCYCMSRFGDKGAYEVGNVFIQSLSENTKEAHIGKPKTKRHREKLRKQLAAIRKRVQVRAGDKVYASLSDAAKANGITPQAVKVRITSKNVKFAHWSMVKVTRGDTLQ